jgi:hypothetical protein
MLRDPDLRLFSAAVLTAAALALLSGRRYVVLTAVVSAALIGMGVLWLFTGNRSVARGGDYVRAGLDRIPDAAGNAFDAARSTVRSGSEAIGERMASMKDAVLDRAGDALDSTARYGREYADAASEYANAMPGATTEIFDTVRSNLSDIFRSQPLALGAIGVAIGAGIAAALPTTELEADYVGETSDTFKKKATAFAEDQAGRATKVAENVLEAVSQEARQQGLTMEAAKSAAGDISTISYDSTFMKWNASPARMCSFAFTTARSYWWREGSRRVEPDPVREPGSADGCGPSSSSATAPGSPQSTSAIPRAWSKRTSISATTKRLSGRSRPSPGTASD